jgi:hypothetical protein
MNFIFREYTTVNPLNIGFLEAQIYFFIFFYLKIFKFF